MRCLLALLVVGLLGCGASDGRNVVTARHVAENSGAPEVTKVTDLGDLTALPASGAISTSASDGTFAIGELVLIEGEDFGKLPTVSIGGRPALNLARTKNGGIVSRIPTEVPEGPVAVEVSHPEGRSHKNIEVMRYLAMAGPDAVYLMSSGAEPSLRHRFDVPGATALAFSHDGQALYVAGPKHETLHVAKVHAKDRPATATRVPIGKDAVHSIVTRTGVPIMAALGFEGVHLYDTRVPTAISELAPLLLPGGARAGVLSPDGHYLAVFGSAQNRLSLIALDLEMVAPAKVVDEIDLLTDDTVPLLRDIVFAPEGDEIWVVSGNNRRSTIAGLRPTTITRVGLADGKLRVLGDATIAKAAAPRFMAVSQRQAIMAAAAVRSTQKRAALLLSSVPAAMVGGNTAGDTSDGQLMRFDLDGNATVLVDGGGIYGRSVLSSDQTQVYAATRVHTRLGITTVPLEGGKAHFLELAADNESDELDDIPLALAP